MWVESVMPFLDECADYLVPNGDFESLLNAVEQVIREGSSQAGGVMASQP